MLSQACLEWEGCATEFQTPHSSASGERREGGGFHHPSLSWYSPLSPASSRSLFKVPRYQSKALHPFRQPETTEFGNFGSQGLWVEDAKAQISAPEFSARKAVENQHPSASSFFSVSISSPFQDATKILPTAAHLHTHKHTDTHTHTHGPTSPVSTTLGLEGLDSEDSKSTERKRAVPRPPFPP